MRTIDKVSTIVGGMLLALAIACGPWAVAAAADRGLGVSAAQLPEELREVTVQSRFIPGRGVPIGTVQNMRGHLIVRRGNDQEAFFAAEGDNLYAHDELFTLEESRVRVRFTTADIVNMGADSRIRVDALLDDRQNHQKKTRLSMLRGKAMFYVMRLFKYNKVDTEVHTPTAVCGVRGTKFGIIVRKKGELLSGMPLYLADASGAPLNYLLADNGGGGTETVMIMEEGSGFMTAGGTTTGLGSGQTGTAGPTGPPATGPTDPNQSQGLNNDTNPDGGGGGGGGDAGGGDGGDGDSGGTGTTGGTGDDSADTVNSVTQQGLTNAGPTRKIGYFSAMLTRNDDGLYPDNVFISDKLQDHEGPDIRGTSLQSGSDILLQGTPGNTPTPSDVNSLYNGPMIDLGPQHQVLATQLGYNQFLEWGYWFITTPMHTSNSAAYVIDNGGVFVHGDPTPLENLAGITGHYAGSAWGTLWNGSGGSRLTGSMSADVALGSTVLNNLEVSATDGTNTVSVLQTGTTYFNGPNGEFMLDNRNAVFSINDYNANGQAIGGLYGPNGEALGGTAAIEDGELGQAAVLGFEGTRQGPPLPPGTQGPPMDVQ